MENQEQNPASNAAAGIFGADLGMNTPAVNVQVNEPVITPPVQQVIAPVAEVKVDAPVITPEVKSEIIYKEEQSVLETPAFDESKYLNDTFGTADKTVIKDRYTKYEQTEKDLTEAALKLQQPKYKNQVTEVLDEILSKVGGDITNQRDFIKNTLDLLTTDETKLDAVSLVKFNLKMNYPQLTSEQVDAHIAQNYQQGEDYSDEQRNAGMVKLLQDSSVAKNALSDLKAKALTNDNDKVNALNTLQEEKRKTEWVQPIKKVVEDFKTIPLSIGKVNGKDAFLNFDVPQDIAKKYEQQIYNSMLTTGDLPNEQSLANARQTMKAVYLLENFDHITKHLASKLSSESIRKEIGEYHNPTIQGNATQRNEVTKVKSRDEAIAESMGWNGNK
jgi:hypothetical protein